MPKATSNAPAPVDASHVRGPDGEVIDLKNRAWAAFLAWLIPGLGHWYQGRRAKAVLYFLCISTTFIWGMYLGGGRVVYAQWTPHDQRWQFFCQAGVGLPAIPAVLQSRRFSATNAYWTNQVDAFKSPSKGQEAKANLPRARLTDWFMAPPLAWSQDLQNVPDELDDLHKRLHRYFDLGTLFTMVAGLLNILVIYDAFAGPAWNEPMPERKPPDDESDKPKS
ncbi:MAG: hypothetical protein JSS27_16315 [Planctomycetes bacterium]|nr:hypothetical protein [Planctomycetota bacterium]